VSEGRRYRPCEIAEAGDVVSLLNEPATDIVRRRELPLSAVLVTIDSARSSARYIWRRGACYRRYRMRRICWAER
jgi:hypothetical protein